MKDFRIVFYHSNEGELKKLNDFHREAESFSDLVNDPPDEFFEAVKTLFPLHGWVEDDGGSPVVFVIFRSKNKIIKNDAEDRSFRNWLRGVKPADFL